MTGLSLGLSRRVVSTSRRLGRVARAATLPAVDPDRIIVVCHCYHVELVGELAAILTRVPAGATLHLTSSRSEVFDAWSALAKSPVAKTEFHLMENLGRDIRPFWTIAPRIRLKAESLVLKLHGKSSSYCAGGPAWRQDLLHGLLPRGFEIRRIAARFDRDAQLGMLGAGGSYLSHPVYWGQNRANVARIMSQAFDGPPDETELGFFAGSMFWIRGSLLSRLARKVDLAAFEPEPLPQDGCYAHAIERIVPMAARRMGFTLGEIGRPEPLDPIAVSERKLAYL